MFGYLCAPGVNESEHRFDFSYEVECKDEEEDKDFKLTAYVAWLLLLLSLGIYIVKETLSLCIQQRCFYKWETYRNLATIITIVLVVHRGSPMTPDLKLRRWQFHVAAGTCLLIWLEMLMLVGKIPKGRERCKAILKIFL